MGSRGERPGSNRLTPAGGLIVAVVVGGLYLSSAASDRAMVLVVWAAALVALVVGVVWPLVAIRGVQIAASSPRDATVGDEVQIEVSATGAMAVYEIRVLDPPGTWVRVDGPTTGFVSHLADTRGVFEFIRFEVRVSAPVGLYEARRIISLALPVPVEVAPRPLSVEWMAAGAPVEMGELALGRGGNGGEVVRSVRPYVVGDPAHLVHWPSTARSTTLVVRELDPPAPIGQAIVLDLRNLGEDCESGAAYALGATYAVLAAGGEVVLCTAESAGAVSARVRSRLGANRRIARAVVGEPGVAPPNWPVVEIGR